LGRRQENLSHFSDEKASAEAEAFLCRFFPL
jgi:hypothetical protein